MEEKRILEELKENFEKIFGYPEEGVFFAPGRVNLIGEHTDYNGGHVFPCALTLGTYAAARKRDDRTIRFASLNIRSGSVTECSLDDPSLRLDGSAGGENDAAGASDWTGYPRGVIWAFAEKGYRLPTGLDVLYYGNIPAGSGLSSSASLEVLTGLVLRELYGFGDVSQVDLAVFGQRAESAYVGMNCGIMDQFASAMGKKNHAIFLDTNTLEYQYAPLALDGMKIVITNSNVKHQLVNSGYNTRREECETALTLLREARRPEELASLGALTPEAFAEMEPLLEEPVRSRARHAVNENYRTIEAVAALNAGDIARFGELMNESHVSLRDDYDVSCEEIDFLVDEAWKVPGVLGSRITGGGFGGCTVSIVRDEAIDEFRTKLSAAYAEKYPSKSAEFYVIEAGEGAHRIS